MSLAVDPIRLLRAVRLGAELGFSLDKDTEQEVPRQAHLIATVAGERMREELLRLLALPDSGGHLGYLDRLGLLTAVIPELALARGVTQPKEHFWDVFDHTLKVVAAVDFLLRRAGWEYGGDEVLPAVPWSEELGLRFDVEVSPGSTRGTLLKLAALFHDIAKPQTQAVDASGRLRFLGHGNQGAEVAARILERLRFSVREIRLVSTLVKHHLRPGQLAQSDELPTHRAIYRFFRDTGDAGIDVIFLSLADHLATWGPRLNLDGWRGHTRVAAYMLKQHMEQASQLASDRLVSGDDLINIFGLKPGPRIGEILENVREAQAARELVSHRAALAYIRALLDRESTLHY
jgi:poly(A) polymerase